MPIKISQPSPPRELATAKLQILGNPEKRLPSLNNTCSNPGDSPATPATATATIASERLVLGERTSHINTEDLSMTSPAPPTSSSNGDISPKAIAVPIEPPVYSSYQSPHDDFDAVSVGLMASGLAWVNRKNSGGRGMAANHVPVPVDISRQQQQLTAQKSNDNNAPVDPFLASTTQALSKTPVFAQLANASLVASTSNGNNSRFSSVNNNPSKQQQEGSMRNLLSVSATRATTVPSPTSTPTRRFYDCAMNADSMTVPDDEDDGDDDDSVVVRDNTNANSNTNDDDYQSALSFGYFCQEEAIMPPIIGTDPSKSPMRAAFDQVLAGMGSASDDDIGSKEDEEDDDNEHDDSGDSDSDEEDATSISWIPPVRCVPEDNCSTDTDMNNVLNPQQMQQIAQHVLPKGIASCQWKRLYSLARDGDSFDICLHYVQNNPKTLLVVRTTRGAILGAFAGEAWTADHQHEYYGNNETCLFTFEEASSPQQETTMSDDSTTPTTGRNTPDAALEEADISPSPIMTSASEASTAAAPPNSPPLVHRIRKSLVDDDDDEDDDEDEDEGEEPVAPIHVYKYTGLNRYIQYCDSAQRMLAFGGGGEEGSFGLCVEQEFQRGSTGHCDTFDNVPLCRQENFRIVDVELWGFLTGRF